MGAAASVPAKPIYLPDKDAPALDGPDRPPVIGGCVSGIAFSIRIHPRLHKLISLGLAPAVVLEVHHKSPSYAITCEQTEFALEEDVARDIYVFILELSPIRIPIWDL